MVDIVRRKDLDLVLGGTVAVQEEEHVDDVAAAGNQRNHLVQVGIEDSHHTVPFDLHTIKGCLIITQRSNFLYACSKTFVKCSS